MSYDRFAVIPMPVDKEGRGPADEKDTVRIVYEVWDTPLQLSLAGDLDLGEAEVVAKVANLTFEHLRRVRELKE